MAIIETLKQELVVDELERGYAEMSDAQVAVSLNTVDRERNKKSLTGSEVLNAIDVTEFTPLDADKKRTVWDIIHLGTVNPFGVEATLMITIFGAGSATITQLAALRKEPVSRATELVLGRVRAGHVGRARRLIEEAE